MKIIDAHLHFYDTNANEHPILEKADPQFAELGVDYTAMARAYLPKDYL
jgi:predicted TIM-barrel fold metal-dependent hydrolase